MHAVILAGGFGTRLRSVVSDVPKPLAPVQGRPFLDWLIAVLARQGVNGVTLSVHHQWEKIRDYFTANPAAVPVDWVVEETPLGTGGAMRYVLAQKEIQEPVLVLNGDSYVRADCRALYAQHQDGNEQFSMVLREVADSGRYGTVQVQEGVVTSFGKGQEGKPGLINAGVYVVSPGIFNEPLPEAFSFEQDFLPPRLAALKPKAFIADGYFIDIGIPDDYARAQRELPEILNAAR